MPEQMPQIVGNWEKISRSPCSQKYPAYLQFQENGLYFAQNDPTSRFIIWDVGNFEIASQKQVQISLANDAVVTYEFSILSDVLTFVDPDGCEFTYRRVT